MLDRRRQDPTTRVGLVVAAAVIVLGILGMHALNLHGTPPMTGMGGMSGMTGSSMSHSSKPGSHANVAAVDSSQPPSLNAPALSGHDMGDMVMLCVAMLASAGIALLALLMLHKLSRWSWALARTSLTTVAGLNEARTGTGPPPAWAFSVIRC